MQSSSTPRPVSRCSSSTHASPRSSPRRSEPGFARLPNRLIDQGVLNDLRPCALRVLLLMLRLADDHGRCWPSQRIIARRTGLTTRSVQYALQELIDAHLIVRERRGKPGQCSAYRLTLTDAAPDDESPAAKSSTSRNGHRDARSMQASRSGVRRITHSRSHASRTPLPTTQTQDSDTQLTHNRAAAAAGQDVCVECARGEATATAAAVDKLLPR